jgi:hypothetical protein
MIVVGTVNTLHRFGEFRRINSGKLRIERGGGIA